MNGYVDKLRAEPGLMVVEVQRGREGPWRVICMKDELARDPTTVIRDAGGNPDDFTITLVPFVSLEPTMVADRVRRRIRPPDTVRMEFTPDGTLKLSGSAPMDWIMQVRQDAFALPGVKRLDFKNLTDPRLGRLQAMVREVEGVTIEFPLGKDTPVPGDVPKLRKVVNTLVALEKLAAEMGMGTQLTIYGHADTLGNDQRNYELSQARAKLMAAMLYGKGSSMPVSLYGMGAQYANKNATSPQGDQASRKIELRVHLTRMSSAAPEDVQ
jgi:OOP family OmpA-OmpF porin